MISIMKSVRFSYSLFAFFLVLKVIRLLLFGPSRTLSSNFMDGLLIEKDNVILTTFIEKIGWYLLKIRLNAYLNVKF